MICRESYPSSAFAWKNSHGPGVPHPCSRPWGLVVWRTCNHGDKTKAVLKEKHENISVIAFFLLSLHEIM